MAALAFLAFLLLMPLQILFLLWLPGYVAHCFLLVLEETAAGKNHVAVYRPNDGLANRLWKVGYLGLLLFLSALPAVAALSWIDLHLPRFAGPFDLLILFYVIALSTAVWLLLPIMLLSVLSSPSHLGVFRWTVVSRLARRPGTLLTCYVASAPLVVGTALVAYLALFGWRELATVAATGSWAWLPAAVEIWSWVILLPLTGVLGAAALLIYARLVGRLAWLLELHLEEDDTPEVPEAEPAPGTADLAVTHDALESDAKPDSATAAETYGLLEDFPPSPAWPDHAQTGVEPSRLAGVLVAEAPLDLEPAPLPSIRVPEPEPAPRRLLVRGIFGFPWYRSSLRAWIIMSIGATLVALLLRVQLLLF